MDIAVKTDVLQKLFVSLNVALTKRFIFIVHCIEIKGDGFVLKGTVFIVTFSGASVRLKKKLW